ncbi:MAG TPA: hypothetical protein DCL77_07665 [Prolixibacteraceae bacterium]|nr:hypothetical protein [Prolixibacteraceae bacterium]
MGTISKGILGGFSGKVGTVIGGSWKGIEYMRSLATSVSNPNSPAQLDQRARFGTMIKFLKPLTAFLRIGFKNQAVRMSAFNAAMSYNFSNAITGAYPVYEIDYTQVLVSQGSLPQALNPTAVSTTAGEIDYSWEDNSSDADAMADDKSVLVVYNPVKKRVVTLEGGNTRTGGSQVITVPASFSGDEVQCYISFQNANGSVISNSQFVKGLVVV